MRDRSFRYQLAVLAGLYTIFLLLPVVTLLGHASSSVLASQIGSPLVVQALVLSLATATVATLLTALGGIPLAWLLARSTRRRARLLLTILELPLVMPPSVAGLALLLAYGRYQTVGEALARIGIGPFAFTPVAVVMAQMVVAAPVFLRAAVTALRGVPERYVRAAAVLGASEARTLATVVLPLARPGLVAGTLQTWARALGELGATMMFAGSLRGVTLTMPTAIFVVWNDNPTAAVTLAVILLALSMASLLAARWVVGEEG